MDLFWPINHLTMWFDFKINKILAIYRSANDCWYQSRRSRSTLYQQTLYQPPFGTFLLTNQRLSFHCFSTSFHCFFYHLWRLFNAFECHWMAHWWVCKSLKPPPPHRSVKFPRSFQTDQVEESGLFHALQAVSNIKSIIKYRYNIFYINIDGDIPTDGVGDALFLSVCPVVPQRHLT